MGEYEQVCYIYNYEYVKVGVHEYKFLSGKYYGKQYLRETQFWTPSDSFEKYQCVK